MELDIKKTSPTPKDKWQAIELMTEAQQNVIEAIHIFNSIIENNTPEHKEFHDKRINEFLNKFKLT